MRKLPVIGEVPNLLRFFRSGGYAYFPCAAIATFAWPAMSYLEGQLLGGMMDAVAAMRLAPVLARLPWVLACIVALALIQAVASYGKDVSLERASMALRSRLLTHILRLPMGRLRDVHSGNYLSQFTVDSGAAIQACDRLVQIVGTLFLSNLAMLGYIFSCSALLGWITIGVAVMSLLFNGGFAPYMRKLNVIQRGRIAQMSERLSDLVGGHTVLRTDNRQDYFTRRTLAALENLFQINWKIKKTSALTSTPAEVSRFLINGVVLAAAILLFTQGKLTSEQVMTCWMLGTSVGFSMRGVARSYMQMQEQLASADRVGALLREDEETQGRETQIARRDPAISFSGVEFAYRKDVPLFQGLSIDFRAGQSVALAGASGGGKSTLALMLMRFYDADAGTVSLFGRDVREYTLPALRKLIAYVPQNAQLFDGTIWENIRYGRPGASDAEILRAAKQARVDAFADAFPDGYQTRVGERGSQLSGGQRQRVAIARALLKDAPILLLDEATASLDNHFERDIQDALRSLPEDRTVITIVHRLSTATGNDRIVLLEGGAVVESGKHAELLEAQGRYWQLWNANASADGGEGAG